MKPTKEQIDAAVFVASHYIHLDLPDWFPPAIRVLCSAIHDLRAELAAERAAHAKTQAEHSEAPTNEELAAEAHVYFRKRTNDAPTEIEVDMYVAGARREGRT